MLSSISPLGERARNSRWWLTTAAYLARAGLHTVVLERRPILGGACVTEEVWPGYRVSTASYVMSLLQPKIIRPTSAGRRPTPAAA